MHAGEKGIFLLTFSYSVLISAQSKPSASHLSFHIHSSVTPPPTLSSSLPDFHTQGGNSSIFSFESLLLCASPSWCHAWADNAQGSLYWHRSGFRWVCGEKRGIQVRQRVRCFLLNSTLQSTLCSEKWTQEFLYKSLSFLQTGKWLPQCDTAELNLAQTPTLVSV